SDRPYRTTAARVGEDDKNSKQQKLQQGPGNGAAREVMPQSQSYPMKVFIPQHAALPRQPHGVQVQVQVRRSGDSEIGEGRITRPPDDLTLADLELCDGGAIAVPVITLLAGELMNPANGAFHRDFLRMV